MNTSMPKIIAITARTGWDILIFIDSRSSFNSFISAILITPVEIYL